MKSSILRLLMIFTFLPVWQIAAVPLPKANSTSQPRKPEYIFPLPLSNYNQAGTTIAIRYGDRLEAGTVASSLFTVNGSVSGAHSGQTVLALDGETVIFKPDRPFSAEETVSVTLQSGISSTWGQTYAPIVFSFVIGKAVPPAVVKSTLAKVSKDDLPPVPASTSSARTAAATTSVYVTAPADFPIINVTTPASTTADGYIFATKYTLPNTTGYLLMLDNNGEPVYYQRMPENTFTFDFKKLSNGNLTYWDSVNSSYRIMDSSYQVINTITAGNGFANIDQHDMQLLPNGDYLYMIYDVEGPIDLTPYGVNNVAMIVSLVVQEQDAARNIVFQWNSAQHVPITDSNQDLTAPVIDYMHGNAVELDTDGNLLVSARHLSEILKIKLNAATFLDVPNIGDTIWTFGGGVANEFDFVLGTGINDVPEFYYQHDIRRLPNGNISLFDNHNAHTPQNSRALEFTLDETRNPTTQRFKATLVWEYRNTPDNFSPFMGDAQRLPNGNTFIGWGGSQTVALTEVDPSGNKLLEMNFNSALWSYRGFRYPWTGTPVVPPKLVLRPSGDTVNLYFSWNGATNTKEYQIYGGNSTATTTPIMNVPKTGFENSTAVPANYSGLCYFRVVPVDNNNIVGLNSNLVLNPACGVKTYFPLITH